LKVDKTLPLLKLFGSTEDNFYQLGLKDREGHEMLLEHTRQIISTPWVKANPLVYQGIKTAISFILDHHPVFEELVKAYAQGLNKPINDILYAFVVPDLFCFMDRWMPGLPHYSFGCSSIFTWCEKREALVHGRILDFPFAGSFDAQERLLLTKHQETGPRIFSIGSSGVPFPSITAMSEYGYTLSVHQKLAGVFEKDGKPIFQLVHDLLEHCKTKNDIFNYLEQTTSLSSWALHIGFKSGEVLSVDMLGNEFYYDEQTIQPGEVLYFNNHLLEENDDEEDHLPYGFNNNCDMRESSFYLKMNQLKFGEKEITAEGLIKMMGTPLKQTNKEKKWQADYLTPSTLQTVCMIPQTNECLLLTGEAPKFFQGDVLRIQDCFNEVTQTNVKVRGTKQDYRYQRGYRHLIKAQVSSDHKDRHHIYHHLQLAMHYLKGHADYDIANFYFCVYSYMYEEHTKILSKLLSDFKQIKAIMPTYFKDQCLLFIARLEKIKFGETTIGIDEFEHRALQKIFEFEMKMPQAFFHSATKTFIVPRIDIMDVLYAHVRAS
jgi:hypothetical protein